jgi:hypothetical protein
LIIIGYMFRYRCGVLVPGSKLWKCSSIL